MQPLLAFLRQVAPSTPPHLLSPEKGVTDSLDLLGNRRGVLDSDACTPRLCVCRSRLGHPARTGRC